MAKEYRIKGPDGRDLGNWSDRKIISRIKSGKFTGDEQASLPPYLEWHKLSSIPDFYDHFLNRLFPDHAADPPPANSVSPNPSQPEDLSSDKDRTREPALNSGEQKAVIQFQEEPKEIGKTIHEEAIQELFGDSLGGGAQKKSSVEMTPNESSEFTQQLSFSADAPPKEIAESFEKERSSLNRSRGFVLAVVLAAGIGYLLFSPSEGKRETTESFLLPSVVRSNPFEKERKEDRVRILLGEADNFYNNDTPLSYQAAQSIYKEANAIDPANAIIYARIAETAARELPFEKDKKRIVGEIQQLIERGRSWDPQSSSFYRVEALLALHSGNLEQAESISQNALETDPTNHENFLVSGEIQYRVGHLGKAKQNLEEVVKSYPSSARAYLLLAQLSFETNALSESKSYVEEALKYSPIYPEGYLLLGDVMAGLGETKKAQSLYDTATRLAKFGPANVIAKSYFRMGILKEAAGAGESAKELFSLAKFYDPDLDGLSAKLKGGSLAEDKVLKLVSEREYGSDYFMVQGDSLVIEGKPADAMKFYQAASLIDTKSAIALVKLGEISESLAGSNEDVLKVESVYRRAIDRDPHDARAYYRLGLLATNQYNFEAGYKLLQQAAQLAPKDAEPLIALGKHFYKRQDYNEAIAKFTAAAQINPNNSEVNYYAGLLRLLYKKDSVRDAQQYFLRAYTADPQNYPALIEWLKLKVAGFDKNFAVKFVRNLLDKDPKNAKLYWALGEIYVANKEYRRGISFYHQSLDLDNRGAKVRYSLAQAHEAVGEFEKAVAEYRLSSLLDRRSVDGFYKASDLLLKLKKFNEAEESLKFLIGITPNYPGAHSLLSKVYQAKRQKDQAIEAIAKEVEINPQNAKTRVEYGELLMEYEKYQDAIKELTEVSNLPPLTKAPEYVFDKLKAYLLLSRCYRALNKPESAEGMVKLGLEIDPKDPELHRELGYIYYALQRDKDGVKEFEYYLNRLPAARDAETIRGIIQRMQIEE